MIWKRYGMTCVSLTALQEAAIACPADAAHASMLCPCQFLNPDQHAEDVEQAVEHPGHDTRRADIGCRVQNSLFAVFL